MGVYDRSRSDLQARLTALLNAYDQLVTGQQVVSMNYSQSDGAKSATFHQADIVRLQGDIDLLQKKLGIIRRARRKISFAMR